MAITLGRLGMKLVAWMIIIVLLAVFIPIFAPWFMRPEVREATALSIMSIVLLVCGISKIVGSKEEPEAAGTVIDGIFLVFLGIMGLATCIPTIVTGHSPVVGPFLDS